MDVRILSIVILAGVLSSADAWLFFSSSGRQQAEGVISEECVRKAEKGDCLFYVCFDQRHPCDYNNYALSYGWKFCDKTEKNYGRFTLQARRWINSTRVCSMTKMLEFYRASHINCKDVQEEMKDNHAACEAEHGICDGDMLMENKEVLQDVFTFDRKVMGRFLHVLQECGVSTGGEFLSWLKDQGKVVVSFLRSLPERFRNLREDMDELRASLPDLPDVDLTELRVNIESLRDSLPSMDLPKFERLPETETED